MSCYIHCHIGQVPPNYLLDSIQSIKTTDPFSKIILITDKNIIVNGIEILKVEEILSKQTKRVMEMSLFKNEANPLWRTSLFRIFLIRDAFKHLGLHYCYHFDSDVLLFCPSSDFEDLISNFDGLNITPCNSNELVFGFSRIGSLDKIDEICSILYKLIFNPFKRIKYYVDMPNEMQLLAGIFKKRPDLIQKLNTFPNEHGIIFDPSSYGQYFGGTHQNHPPGFTDLKHDIGVQIKNGNIIPIMIENKPYVEQGGNLFAIANLHIHSKNTTQFLGK